MPEPLLTAAMFSSAIVGTLTNMTCDAGVKRAIAAAAKRSLSLGILDPNHELARAACVAQINVAAVLVVRAQEAEKKTTYIGGGNFYRRTSQGRMRRPANA